MNISWQTWTVLPCSALMNVVCKGYGGGGWRSRVILAFLSSIACLIAALWSLLLRCCSTDARTVQICSLLWYVCGSLWNTWQIPDKYLNIWSLFKFNFWGKLVTWPFAFFYATNSSRTLLPFILLLVWKLLSLLVIPRDRRHNRYMDCHFTSSHPASRAKKMPHDHFESVFVFVQNMKFQILIFKFIGITYVL